MRRVFDSITDLTPVQIFESASRAWGAAGVVCVPSPIWDALVRGVEELETDRAMLEFLINENGRVIRTAGGKYFVASDTFLGQTMGTAHEAIRAAMGHRV